MYMYMLIVRKYCVIHLFLLNKAVDNYHMYFVSYLCAET